MMTITVAPTDKMMTELSSTAVLNFSKHPGSFEGGFVLQSG